MIIQHALIDMRAEHRAEEQNIREERLSIWRGAGPGTTPEHGSLPSSASHRLRDRIHLSEDARKEAALQTIATPVQEEEAAIADLNIPILWAMIQRLTGIVLDIRLPQVPLGSMVSTSLTMNMNQPVLLQMVSCILLMARKFVSGSN